ncbi:ATP-binding protein [Burkholderia gladioli]|uniref:ATP-binding protein n=1 Tax=Burkholderia gladioli TaxID=28095 RepID=UPI000D001F40|nr:ATP-binding protein [Burkholderia gladioli]MBU9172110.1 HAMP domain-containing protein [Burkholderia gladioli]MBU9179335.1 HAMP domain-containing protein [Burkholderia gladioli]MBU9218469.1 HAMP domain-containing protein [Burkholderia gladioli]MBU9384327.1 HAMP domain-containing protein [Burkholderia gladioli]MDN7728045.1 ATP-binding protein [Burkholderia gladioli]
MRRFLSTTLGQILAIIACSSVATFLIFVGLLSALASPPAPPWPWQSAYRIAALVENLRAVPAAERERVLAATRLPGMTARFDPPARACTGLTFDTHDLRLTLDTLLPGQSGIVTGGCASAPAGQSIDVRIPLDGRMLDIRTDRSGVEPKRFTFPFYGALIFLCIGVAAMSAWAIARVIRPLRRLSEQADAFGEEMSMQPIEEEGPLEIRRAAHAFNRMQERITRSVQDRTRMLAAISHDLRTPLTRMRLQVETGKTELARPKLLRDIDLMHAMVVSALAFLGSRTTRENKEWLDLGALISTLCDEYAESGAAIECCGPEQVRLFCRPDSMHRMLTNLIDNALEFGERVVVSTAVEAGTVRIEVIDDGPGIPEARLADVVKPFVRLDASRGGAPGSVGLGLSIVYEIVQAHGGRFTLQNRQPSGLVARVEFDYAG